MPCPNAMLGNPAAMRGGVLRRRANSNIRRPPARYDITVFRIQSPLKCYSLRRNEYCRVEEGLLLLPNSYSMIRVM